MGRTRTLRYRYKYLRRTVIAAPVAIAIVLLVFLALWRALESETLRTAVAKRVESLVARATGMELQIGRLGWRVFPPQVVLSDTTLSGQAVHLEINRAAVDIGGLWVAHRTVILDAVEIRGVRVELRDVDSPHERKRGDFPVHVVLKHLDVHGVEFVGDRLPGGVSALLEGLDLAWFVEDGRTLGFVTVDHVDVEARGIERIQASLAARFNWDDAHGLTVPTWRIESEDVHLQGALAWSEERLGATISGDVELAEIDRVVRAHGILQGRMTVAAQVDFDDEPRVTARLHGKKISVEDFLLTDFRAQLDLARGELRGRVESARFFSGALQGTYRLKSLAYPFPHEVEATCEGMELAAFLESLGVPSGGLSASADVTTTLSWESDHFPRGNGLASLVFEPGSGDLPLSGALQLELLPPGVLQFTANDLQVGSSTLSLEGPLTLKTWEPAWAIRADPGVLEEIVPAVNRWVGSQALPEDIAGHGRVGVTLSGPWHRLLVGVRLDIFELSYPPVVLDRATLEAQISEGECRIDQARFSLGEGGGEMHGALRWDTGAGQDGLDLRIEGRQLSLNRAASWLGLGDLAAVGDVSFAGGLSGTIAEPRGSWAVGVTNVEVGGQVVGNGSATVDLSDGVFSVRKLDFDSGLKGGVRWSPGAGVLNGDLRWSEVELHDQPDWARRFFGSQFDLDLDFDWPYRDGAVEGALIIDAASGHFGATFDASGLTARARLAGMAEAELAVVPDASGPGWHGTGQVRLLSAAELVQAMTPNLDVPLVGRSTVDFDLVGEGTTILELRGALGDSEFKLNDHPVQIVSDRGFVWDQGGFRLAGIEASTDSESVFFRAEIGADGGLSGNISGSIDAVLLRFLLPDWEPAGRATGVVELLGSMDGVQLEGIARVEGGSFRLPQSRSVVSDINGSVFLSSTEIALEDMRFRFMRGDGRCRGVIAIRDGEPRLRLGGTVTGLEYPLFPGLAPRLGGTWNLDGAVTDLRLSGDLVIERGEVRGRDDLATLLVEWFGQEGPPRKEMLQLDIRVRADESLVARSPFLRVVGSADLHVTGTDAQPGLVGRVEFQEGGEFTLQGVRYELDRGQITFSDPTRIDPMFDFQTRARILDYEVFLQLSGTQDRLVPSVSSDPPLSPAEIYSLMALGQVGEGRAGGALGINLASSMLTKTLNQTLSGRDGWLLPVDQIRVDPYIEAHTGDPSARVTVVKQLSPSVTVTLQSNLTGETAEVISVRWYTGSGYFWEASRDADGGVGADLKPRRRY